MFFLHGYGRRIKRMLFMGSAVFTTLLMGGCKTFRLEMTSRGNPAQLWLEQELARYCSAPSINPPLQKEFIFSKCRTFLSSIVRFDDSFHVTPLSRKRKERFLHSLVNVAMDPFTWPKDNQFFIFPEIMFPQKMQCDFAPETNPVLCKDSPKHLEQTTLAQRMLGYILATQYTFFYVTSKNEVDEQDIMDDEEENIFYHEYHPIYIHTKGISTKKKELGIYLHDQFWRFKDLKKIGILLHEIEHVQTNRTHVRCANTIQLTCDDSLETELLAFNLLMHDILLRKKLKTYQELIKKNPEDIEEVEFQKRQFCISIAEQHRWLLSIIHLPVQPQKKEYLCYPFARSIEKFLE